MQKEMVWLIIGVAVAYLLLEETIMSTGDSLLDKWAQAIQRMEGWTPTSLSKRNNNPGNIKAGSQPWQGQVGVDSRGFVIFDSYENGIRALKIILTNAATGQSTIYHPTDTLYDFFGKYAPDADSNNSRQYAQYVANSIGVSPDTPISQLV